MNYWLVKSEPSVYGWEQFLKDKKTSWDSIRNYAARNNLRDMRKGDEVFFYHSNEGMEIVGIATVVNESYQDPTTEDKNWLAVDLSPLKKLKKPVTLIQIKNDPGLSQMELVRIPRLSVQKVNPKEWSRIIKLSGTK
ncbi:MAG TPA: EVE domain-containing protein [Chitinophagaceae bacterium]|nr:EVE domain-containing protein [Chitinophagaceae bacterium]